MAVANNADDYAAGRQNIFFTAHNNTSADGNLTGQCVTLLKWFFQDMCNGFPSPFAARGDARYVGQTLVAQGLADEVPWDQRRRGDMVCYEFGTYGHIASVLSGGRVFEENVNWSGVARKLVDGAYVYASRIGREDETWRVGKNPHIYRLKSYNETGDDMSTIGDYEARILIKHIYGYTDELDIESAIPALVGGESNTVIRRMDSTETAAAYQKQIADWKAQKRNSDVKPYDGPPLFTKK